ncbi:MAG: zinc ribbon domain-containing protein [Opitutales bacterium]|nr:zinc ribbon domain-containing protein [Opitutales bacterium]
MPTYEYVCDACGSEFEAFQRMSESLLTDCSSCGESRLRRKIGRGAGFIFKGGGFYETDFKDKKGKKEETAPASKESSTASSSDKPVSGESKEASKPSEKSAPVAASA